MSVLMEPCETLHWLILTKMAPLDTDLTGPSLDDDMPPAGTSIGDWREGPSFYDQLCDQHRLVVDFYVMDPSSFKNACLSAGYSKRAISSIAHELHHKPSMAAAIAEKMNGRAERTMITQDRILHELAIIAFSDLRNYTINPKTGQIELPEGVPDFVMRAVSSIKFIVTIDEAGHERRTLEFKLWDKMGALRMMGQHLAMFTDKLDVRGELDVRQKWLIGDKEIIF